MLKFLAFLALVFLSGCSKQTIPDAEKEAGDIETVYDDMKVLEQDLKS